MENTLELPQVLLVNGRPLADMNREELVEAIYRLRHIAEQQRKVLDDTLQLVPLGAFE